jgi:hypothetical protein
LCFARLGSSQFKMGKQSEKATPQNSGMKQKSISSFFAAKPKSKASPSKKPGGGQQN